MLPHSCCVLEAILPSDVVSVIKSFLPYSSKKKKNDVSPSLQRELKRIQSTTLKGKSGMYLKDFEDFCLD